MRLCVYMNPVRLRAEREKARVDLQAFSSQPAGGNTHERGEQEATQRSAVFFSNLGGAVGSLRHSSSRPSSLTSLRVPIFASTLERATPETRESQERSMCLIISAYCSLLLCRSLRTSNFGGLGRGVTMYEGLVVSSQNTPLLLLVLERLEILL